MKLVAFRLGYGAILLLAPAAEISRVVRHPLDQNSRRIARVLGVRQLLQGALEATVATPTRQRVGAGVDAVHCVSMVAAALTWPRYRRLARKDATIAALLSVAGMARARTL